jgi:hypothetical protein
MVGNGEWLVAAHQDEFIRHAEQARLIRRCRADNAAQEPLVRRLRAKTDKARTALLRQLRPSGFHGE